MPGRALLNDANPHLINFYRWLQKGLRVDLLMENDEGLFYRHRDRFNALLTAGHSESREAAAIFYYLNRTGFNGLCRFNRSGEFNVLFGRYARIGYTRDFSPYCDAFMEWTQYAKDGFAWEDQERTAAWLAKHAGPVVLVNQATERVEKLYRQLGYQVRFLKAPRRISCTGDRTPAREIMRYWTGYDSMQTTRRSRPRPWCSATRPANRSVDSEQRG